MIIGYARVSTEQQSLNRQYTMPNKKTEGEAMIIS